MDSPSKKQQSIVALLTDFGQRDGFVGVMKGVVYNVYREAILMDVAHDVPPQDVWHASWVLDQAFDVLPEKTVVTCVVDPAVGSEQQKAILIYFEGLEKAIVTPDNGLASRVLQQHEPSCVVHIQNTGLYWDEEPSQTFHGRDIYAPVAAHAAKALHAEQMRGFLAELGTFCDVSDLVTTVPPLPTQIGAGSWQGVVDTCDCYGNVITTVPSDGLDDSAQQYELHILREKEAPIVRRLTCVMAYERLSAGEFGIAPGSHGCLEIVLFQGNAWAELGLKPLTSIELLPV